MDKVISILKTQPALFGLASIITGLISLGFRFFYISPIPIGLAIYGLVKTKQQRDLGNPSKEALIMNFMGLALGAFAFIILVFVLIVVLATALLPS